MAEHYYSLLNDIARFVKHNYEPFMEVSEEDIALMLVPSYDTGTFFPIIAGSGPNADLIAFYEYWTITSEYLERLANANGDGLPLPTQGDRDGDILFCPIAVISQEFRGKAFNLTRIALAKLQQEYPEADGLYRWVLKEQKLHHIPFKRKEG